MKNKLAQGFSTLTVLTVMFGTSIDDASALTWEGTQGLNQQVFAANCATSSCHDGTSFPDLRSEVQASNNIGTIITRINLPESNIQSMPRLQAQMDEALIDLVEAWSAAGTPNTATPQVSTNSATAVTKYSATMRGAVNENGVDTPVDFEYATNAAFTASSTTSDESPSGTGGGTSLTSYSTAVSGLACGTTYYFRARALSADFGNVLGTSSTFSTGVCNAQPMITSNAPTGATEDQSYSYQVLVSDADDSSFSFDLVNAPQGMNISVSGLITWTPSEGVTSSGLVTVRAADGLEDGVTRATQQFTVSVNPVNDPPIITSNAPTQNAIEGQLFSFQAAVSDPDDSNNGTDLSWSIIDPQGDMDISSTGLLTWTPQNGVSSSGEITLQVADDGEDGALAAQQRFTINVTAVNDPPSITSTAGTQATEDQLYTYTPAVTDVDDANDGSGALVWTLIDPPLGMEITDTGTVSWTPREGVSTSGAVTIQVADGQEDGAIPAQEEFTVAVTAVNDPPFFNSTAPGDAVEGNEYLYTPARDNGTVAIDPDDPNDGSGALRWSLEDQPQGMSVSPTGVVSWTPPNGVTAVGPITLRVEDDDVSNPLSFEQQFSVSVSATNTPPVLSAVPDGAATEDLEFSYQLMVSDDDDANDGVNLLFGLANAPSGMQISNTGLITWTPREGDANANNIEVSVADGGENGATVQRDTFNIAVTAVNDQPSLAVVSDLNATEDVPYSYQAQVSDPDDSNDGVNLLWRAENLPLGMTLSDTGLLQWTPVEGQTSSGQVSLFVRDGGEDGSVEQQQDFVIAVRAVNDAPVLGPVTLVTATEDLPYQFQAQVSDSDDTNDGSGSLNWQLQNAPLGMDISNQGFISWTPAEGVLSSGEVVLQVSDGLEDGVSVQAQVFTISVTPVNDAPLISSVAPSTALEANLYQYQVAVIDPDDANNGVDLDFVLMNAPDGMSISPTGLIHWVPPEGTRSSDEITLRVSDGGEDSAAAAQQSFTISVGIFNSPPSIESDAPSSATEDEEYRYQVIAVDVDDPNNGADLQFYLADAPEGMLVSSTGLVSWTPLEGILSSGEVTLTVEDGGEDDAPPAIEVFTIAVTPVNDAPLIQSTAPSAVIELNRYSYQVMVNDPDDANDGSGALVFELVNAPQGMSVSATGLIEWIPDEGTRSSGEVIISVSDGGEDGAVAASQSFTVAVTEFNTPPIVISTAITRATEDLLYEYQLVVDDIDDPNDGSGALRFELSDAPEGMIISETGLISWTPSEGVSSSGEVAVTVSDGGEDSAAPARQTFTVAVTQINDAPVITSTALLEVIEDEEYRYALEVEDPDDSNNGADLTYLLSNAPEGMRVSSRGVITWPTDENSPPSSTVTVSVADGGEDGVSPVSQTFTITVNFDEDNDTIVNDSDNCRQTANLDQADNDADGEGDVCDLDDDNDGIDDEYELANNLDPFDPADAAADPDGDGQTNLDEFLAGSNPNVDDRPPVITAPQNIRRNATGFETYIDLGDAVASDFLNGPLTATPSRPSGLFPSGRHRIIWSAVDALGNRGETEQIVDIIPQLTVARTQIAQEGQRATVKFALSGEPVRYPVRFNYRVSGTADGTDHNLRNGVFELFERQGELQFTLLSDDVADAGETVVLEISDPSNAILGPQARHQLTIIEANAPPRVSLRVNQDGLPGLRLSRDGGLVTIDTEVSDPNVDENFEFDWRDSDNRLNSDLGPLDSRFVFDPEFLQPGIYKVQVRVADSSGAAVNAFVLLHIGDSGDIDSDSNGIADEMDRGSAPHAIQRDRDGAFVQTETALKISLGSTATYGGGEGAWIDLETLAQFGDDGGAALSASDLNFASGLYDFVIEGLGENGQSVWVVLPQSAPIPANARYRKFVVNGWQDFVEDEQNQVASTKAIGGACPPPGAAAYQAGLIEGADCVALYIEDGGPNDADAQANGIVRDPGGVAAAPASNGSGNNASNKSVGGGAINWQEIMVLLLLVLLTYIATCSKQGRKLPKS